MSVRRWMESEIDTLTDIPKLDLTTPPAPVKRKALEQEPERLRPATRAEVEAIEDQILRLAFSRAMKSIRFRTVAMIFIAGVIAGFAALGVTLVVLLDKAGAN